MVQSTVSWSSWDSTFGDVLPVRSYREVRGVSITPARQETWPTPPTPAPLGPLLTLTLLSGG